MKSNCGTCSAFWLFDFSGGGMASNAASPGPRMGCVGGWYPWGYVVDVGVGEDEGVAAPVVRLPNNASSGFDACGGGGGGGGGATDKSPSCANKSIGFAAGIGAADDDEAT